MEIAPHAHNRISVLSRLRQGHRGSPPFVAHALACSVDTPVDVSFFCGIPPGMLLAGRTSRGISTLHALQKPILEVIDSAALCQWTRIAKIRPWTCQVSEPCDGSPRVVPAEACATADDKPSFPVRSRHE